MKILFLNSAPIIKYGLKPGFEKNGWETSILTFPHECNAESFIERVDEFKPDYVLMEGGIDFDKWIFPVVQEKGLKMIYWAIEDPIWVDSLSLNWGNNSVLVATPCIETLDFYAENNIKAVSVPFAIDPDFHNYKGITERYTKLDAICIANNYDYYDTRLKGYQDIIQPFIDMDYKIDIYGGKEWVNRSFRFNIPDANYAGHMTMEESLFAYSSTKYVLGIHSVVDSRTMQSMRTFEVLGCRGFYLSSYTKSLEVMFENHKHLIYSSSFEETVELILHYNDREDERNKIALAGQQLVYEKHTYEQRAKDIIDALSEI